MIPKNLKRKPVIVFGLAALFYQSFMFAKHDPGLRSVIPFGEDHVMPLAHSVSSLVRSL